MTRREGKFQIYDGIPARQLARWILDNISDETTKISFTPDANESSLVFGIQKVSWNASWQSILLEEAPKHMSVEYRNWLKRLNDVPR